MADVVIKINGDVKNFSDALEKAKKQTEDLSEGLTSIAKVSGVAFAALTAEIGLAVKAFAESEAAGRKLTVALQNQGIYSKKLEQDYKDQASALQQLTGVDDDAIISSQALLQSMLGQTPVTQELSQAILDLSAAKDIDLQSATSLIGKGIEGQTMALKKLGIEVDAHLTKEERTAQILEQVTQKFGGQAAAANQGLGGIKGLTSAFGDLQEEIGARFAPVISSAIKKLTDFTVAVKNNQPLIDMGAKILGAGVAVTGLVAALSTAGIALVSAKAIIAALGLTVGTLTLPIALVTAAVVALGAAFGATFAKSMQAPAEALDEQIGKLHERIAALKSQSAGGFNFFNERDIKKAEADLDALMLKRQRLQTSEAAESGGGQDDALKKAAEKRAADQRAEEARERAALQAHQEQLLLQMEGASAETMAFKKQEAELLKEIENEKNTAIRDQLRAQLEEVRRLEAEHEELNSGYRNEQFQRQLETNEEYQALSHEQKMRFLEENRNLLLEGINDADITERNAAKKKAQDQVKAHNEYLENQRKFGTAYAAINQFMHSEVYQGTKSAAGDLAALQQSSNSTLKGIGKAAAIANIIIKTGESAMNIFAGFSTIPFIGPALGVAGAAAAVAFGAEQVGRVTAAASGGMITGGMPGVDSVAALLQQGELVSPRQNFEEVVGSVRAAREAEKILPALASGANGGSVDGGGERGYAEVVLSIKGELMDWIDAQVIERRRINISTI